MDWSKRPKVEEPEIRRLDLAEVALVLAAAGAGRLRDFRWVDKPEESSVVRAERLLVDLGATKGVGGELTETGKKMAGWPVHPRLARMLIEAGALGCLPWGGGDGGSSLGAAFVAEDGGKEGRGGGRFCGRRRRRVISFVWLRALRFAEREKFHPGACGRMGIHGGSAREAAAVRDRLLSVSQAMGLKIEESPASGEKVAEVYFGRVFRSFGASAGWGNLAVSAFGGTGGIDWPRECGAGSVVGGGGGDEGDWPNGW